MNCVALVRSQYLMFIVLKRKNKTHTKPLQRDGYGVRSILLKLFLSLLICIMGLRY